MTRVFRLFALIGLLSSILLSCQCSNSQKSTAPPQTRKEIEDRRMEAQKQFLKKERASILAYMKDRKLDLERTGTGLYYKLTKDSASEKITTGDDVSFEYDMYLMNGTLVYSSAKEGTRKLLVDREDAEIGIHEILKLMSVGDKGLFILPSHLAFGVAGDQNKIPPKTALVYEVKILNVNKSKSKLE